jgi:hypothetical protein
MKLAVKALSLMLAAAMVLAPGAARAQGQGANNPPKNIPVVGDVTGALDSATGQVSKATGTLTGTLDIERFEDVGGQLFAVGQLSGKVNDKPFHHQAVAIPVASVNGTTTSSIGGFGALGTTPKGRQAAMPGYGGNPLVVPAQSCPILNLVLGPLDLNLLGLVVTLNQIHLNITAQGGNGNLLGNLLCAVANLLNGGGGGLGATLTNLLNAITNVLNGILAGL